MAIDSKRTGKRAVNTESPNDGDSSGVNCLTSPSEERFPLRSKAAGANLRANFVGTTVVHHPDPKNFQAYRELIPIYIRLSRSLQPEYKNIAEYQRRHEHEDEDAEKSE